MASPIAQRVDQLRRQLTQHRWATALAWIVVAILSVGLALGLVDYFVRYVDPGLRLIATTVFVVAAAAAAWHLLGPVLRRPITPLAVARQIECHFPHLADRLASSSEFLRQSESDPLAGSAALRRAVVAETNDLVAELPVVEVVDRRPLRRALASAAGAVGVLLFAALINPAAVGTGATRLLAPLGETDWPRRHQLALRNLPTQLAAGDSLEFEVVDNQGQLPDDVQIHYRLQGDGISKVESGSLQRVGDVMVVRHDAVHRPIDVRATGGDHHTMPWHPVAVINPPRIDSLVVRATPPAYTGWPDRQIDGDAKLLAGTTLELEGTADVPLQAARVRFESEAEIVTQVSPATRTVRVSNGTWTATESDAWWLELEGATGVVGATEPRRLHVVEDAPPSVSWISPRRDLFLLPTAEVQLSVAAKDDLQIRAIDVHYTRSDRTEEDSTRLELYRGPSTVAQSEQAEWPAVGDAHEARRAWQLEPLELVPGVQLTLVATASDYRPQTGQAPSSRYVTIISSDELADRIADRQMQIAQRLQTALQDQLSARQQVRDVELSLQEESSDQLAERDGLQTGQYQQRRVATQLADQTHGIPADITQLLNELDANGVPAAQLRASMQRLDGALSQLAENELANVRQQLAAAIKDLGSPHVDTRQLLARLAQTGGDQERIAHQLEKLLDELAEWAGHQRFARETAQIKRLQRELRQATADQLADQAMTNASRNAAARQEELAKRQAALTARFDKLRLDMEQASRQAPTGQSSTQALANAIQRATALGTSNKLHEAHDRVDQRQLGRATQIQQDIENDLTEILAALRNETRDQSAASQLDRLAEVVQKFISTQSSIHTATQAIDRDHPLGTHWSRDEGHRIVALASQQRALTDEVRQVASALQGVGVFRTALGAAAHDMEDSAQLLAAQQLGPSTQRHQHRAIARLEQIARALEREPPTDDSQQNQGGADSGGQTSPQQPPLFQLAEIKLLRAMQADLNRRTVGATDESNGPGNPASALSVEQGQLAELVKEILARNNNQGGESAPDPLPFDPHDKSLWDLFERLDQELGQ